MTGRAAFACQQLDPSLLRDMADRRTPSGQPTCPNEFITCTVGDTTQNKL
jgi:hypothetical protein